MKTIDVTISGKTPLLLNAFSDQSGLAASSGSSSSIRNDAEDSRSACMRCLYYHPNDPEQLIIPGKNVFSCIIEAGKFHKLGKSKLTTQATSLVPASMVVNEAYIDLQYENDWKVDTQPVRIPSTGGRILKHRPCFDDWKLNFTVDLDESMMTEKLCRDLIDDAGSKIGLGDYRPARKGPYGRFVVVNWQVV